MSGRLSPESWAWLQRSHALVNRGLERYPPGSVFKIVTAAAALETGKADAGSYFYCPGVYHKIHCWKRAGHGTLGLTESIAQSCNVAFMHMAEDVGITSLAKMARRFGLGERTGLEVLPERRGLVPDTAWAKETGRRWQLGDTLQTGMGQSFLTITPLQGARVVAAIANGGKLVTPRLVQQMGNEIIPITPPESIGLKPGTLRVIARGLRAVTHGEGTARSLDPALRIAGKTGTAQNPGADHAWFIGYAPADAPTIAVAVLVEHGGHGGAAAAPIAEAVIRAQQAPNGL
ncbi:MAG: Stage V sporulation protein D [bacterium ADurb.Bin429]|nr:MAG: Stage V sporulation protein D [bacterium ADurb.Bin429]